MNELCTKDSIVTPKIELVALDKDNWETCVNLTDKGDKHIYPNLFSIAEAQFYDKAISRAIYVDQEMVGYAMYGEDEDDPRAWVIDRFMIAKAFRRKGYGGEAIKRIMDLGRSRGYRRFTTSTESTNIAMRILLTKLGFETDLERRDDEILYFIEE